MIRKDIVESLSAFLQSQQGSVLSPMGELAEGYDEIMNDPPYRSALLSDCLLQRYQYMRSLRYNMAALRHLPDRRVTSTTEEKREGYQNDIRKALAGILETLLKERMLRPQSTFDCSVFMQYCHLAKAGGCLKEETVQAYEEAVILLEQLT